MIPAKTREDFTNIFFTNYINSCGGVLSAAFEVDLRVSRESKSCRENCARIYACQVSLIVRLKGCTTS